MTRRWENPVARHAGRLLARGSRPWVVLLLLLVAGALGALLQRYAMGMEDYSLHTHAVTQWSGLVLIAETVIALPWAAVRGALLWRRLRVDGHLDEYRRSRLAPLTIVWGAAAAALTPVVLLLAASLAVALVVAFAGGQTPVVGVVVAHLLLLIQAWAAAVGGLWLSGRLRYPAAAIPMALVLMTVAIGAIWAIDPFYRRMDDPTRWIYAALLPNPVTAVGNALETDVLRLDWVYRHIHAHEYFFVYPPAWQTGALYLAAGGVLLAGVTRRVAREEHA